MDIGDVVIGLVSAMPAAYFIQSDHCRQMTMQKDGDEPRGGIFVVFKAHEAGKGEPYRVHFMIFIRRFAKEGSGNKISAIGFRDNERR